MRRLDGTPTILTYPVVNNEEIKQNKTNELGLSDNVMEEECRV